LHAKRRARVADRVRDLVARRLERVVWRERGGEERLSSSLDRIERGDETPYSVAAAIAAQAGLDGQEPSQEE
jgi:putative protein kinase ArgK-like GTPase of G3E family